MRRPRCCDLAGIEYLEVHGRRVGVLGLREAFEAVACLPLAGGRELAVALLEEVKRRNWIPTEEEEAYAQALVEAYTRWRMSKAKP